MAKAFGRTIAGAFIGMILAAIYAVLANKFSANEHLLLIEGHDAFGIVLYASAVVGTSAGAIIGAVLGAAEFIVDTIRQERQQPIRNAPLPSSGQGRLGT